MLTTSAGLYLHIPFCARKCLYCDFYSLPGHAESFQESYVNALITHIREAALYSGRRSGGGSVLIDTVFVGGGTPTVLGSKRLCRLLDQVGKFYQLSSNAEITVEANPATVSLKDLKKLRKSGYNRLSVGVQAVQDPLLNSLGRSHTTEEAADTVQDAAKAGFENISVDLMYGLPEQSSEMAMESLKTVLTWPITHISFYGLKLSEESPMGRLNPPLPADETQADLYLQACDFLESNGFLQYEISNFSKKGYACRHNLKYWSMEPYLGFGASAHSDFGGKRYSFVRDADAYIQGVRDADSILDEHEQAPLVERAGEYIMLGLRTTKGISSNEYTRRFRASFDSLEAKLERCAKWDLAEMIGDRWRLTPRGFLVSNQIIGELMSTDDEQSTTDNGQLTMDN